MPAGWSPYRPSKYRRALEAAGKAFGIAPVKLRNLRYHNNAVRARLIYFHLCATTPGEFADATIFVGIKTKPLKWITARHAQLVESDPAYAARVILARRIFENSG